MSEINSLIVKSFLIFSSLLFLLEIFVRFSGLADYPLYRTTDTTGYELQPGQHGVFLRKNHWYVNRDGFNNDKEFLPTHPSTLLVGDSIVYGGNPVDYGNRIGTLLSGLLGQNVWVGAAGGWSLFNELGFLQEKKKIARQTDQLVIIYDNGDLDGLAPWGGEMVHPTYRTILSLPYVWMRYIQPKIFHSTPPAELPAIPAVVSTIRNDQWKAKLDDLISWYQGSILFLLYPDQQALVNAKLWQEETKDIREYISTHTDKIKVVDVRSIPEWKNSLYRDGIHPNTEGNRILAEVIFRQLQYQKGKIHQNQ
jgi:hypothetical protein